MIYRFHRFVWCRLACTNRFWPTLTDRLWPDRLSHSLCGQLVWQLGRAGEGRGGKEGRGGEGRGGRSWRESPVGARCPGWDRSLVVANISRFFCRLPTLISYVSNLVCHLKRPYSGRGVTRCPESPDVCFLSVRGSVLHEV